MLPKVSMGETESRSVKRCNKTVKLDFENKRFGEMIDGKDALRQAIYMALAVKRYEYPIFSHSYGTNYAGIFEDGYMTDIGKLKNAIEDSLLCDDRILSVSDFNFTKKRKAILVGFSVTSVYGKDEFETEVG